MITGIDIHTDRVSYIVHLEGEDSLFWITPKTDDGSNEWRRIKTWLDAGNNVTDRLGWRDLYSGDRRVTYPKIADQLDMIWHAIDNNTLDKTSEFYTTLKSVKDNNPKP